MKPMELGVTWEGKYGTENGVLTNIDPSTREAGSTLLVVPSRNEAAGALTAREGNAVLHFDPLRATEDFIKAASAAGFVLAPK